MSVRKDLEALRAMIGTKSTSDDGVLSQCLTAATAWIRDRILPSDLDHPEVTQATLLLAARLYKRRLSPEGVAGWSDLGVIRVVARDPDIERLIEQHIDAYKAWGIA